MWNDSGAYHTFTISIEFELNNITILLRFYTVRYEIITYFHGIISSGQ